MDFDKAYDRLIGHEGGYSFHKDDPGGETMWGVTKAVALENGYTGPMKDLPRDNAKAIYRAKYWEKIQADKIPSFLCFDVFDAAVNSGTTQAIKWMQSAVGANPDGILGPMTLQAAAIGDKLAVARFNGIRLMAMTEMKPWPTFSRGWARRVAGNLQVLYG